MAFRPAGAAFAVLVVDALSGGHRDTAVARSPRYSVAIYWRQCARQACKTVRVLKAGRIIGGPCVPVASWSRPTCVVKLFGGYRPYLLSVPGASVGMSRVVRCSCPRARSTVPLPYRVRVYGAPTGEAFGARL
jgi:hypothetical protein